MQNYNQNLKEIFNYYGEENQRQQLIQELAELTVAITKNDTENFIEEMADVQVMIDQFTLAHPYISSKIFHIKQYKAQRQIQRIKETHKSEI